jgi:hypothetical protein
MFAWFVTRYLEAAPQIPASCAWTLFDAALKLQALLGHPSFGISRTTVPGGWYGPLKCVYTLKDRLASKMSTTATSTGRRLLSSCSSSNMGRKQKRKQQKQQNQQQTQVEANRSG